MVEIEDIIEQVQNLKNSGVTIEINFKLPTVAVVYPDGKTWFFQGDEAEELIDRADQADELTFEESILWESTGWT